MYLKGIEFSQILRTVFFSLIKLDGLCIFIILSPYGLLKNFDEHVDFEVIICLIPCRAFFGLFAEKSASILCLHSHFPIFNVFLYNDLLCV